MDFPNFSAVNLHIVHKDALSYADILARQTALQVAVGQVVKVAEEAQPIRLFYGVSNSKYKEFGFATDIPQISVTDSATLNLNYANGEISGSVNIAQKPGNFLQTAPDGLFATTYVRSVSETPTVLVEVDINGNLTAGAKVSTATGNILAQTATGLFVQAPTVDFRTIADTDTVDLTLANGELKADVKIDPASGNNLSLIQNGLFVQRLAIHPDSEGLATVTVDYKLKLSKLIQGEVFRYAASNSTIASYIASAQFATDAPQTMDVVALENAATGGLEIWMCTSATPTTSADFLLIEHPEVTDAYIRSRINAGNGWNWNASTGTGSAKISTDVSNDLTFGTDNGLFVDTANSTVYLTSLAKSETIENIINLILNSGVFGAENGIYKDGSVVRLGGDLTENTTINGLSNTLTFNGGSVAFASGTKVQMSTDIVYSASTDGDVRKDSDGSYWKFTVTTAGQLISKKGTVVAGVFVPNS